MDKESDVADRISELPECIRHDIVARLPRKTRVRISTLSKTWKSTWDSYPELNFIETLVIPELVNLLPFQEYGEDTWRKTYEFMNYVDTTLQRHCRENLLTKKLRLYAILFDSECVSRVNNWIRLVAGNSSFDSLHLCIVKEGGYIVPSETFSSKSIKNLLLGGCSLELPVSRDSIKLPCLQVLHLLKVRLDGEILESLILSCPLIDDIWLVDCTGLEVFKVSTLPKLKKVLVSGKNGEGSIVRRVEIKAPNLERFYYNPSSSFVDNVWEINMAICKNLKELTLSFASMNEELLQQIIRELPLLETLTLAGIRNMKKIKISSHRLKWLELGYCHEEEFNIDTPNLQYFRYGPRCYTCPCVFSVEASNLKDSRLFLRGLNQYIDTPWFIKLRKILQHFNDMTLAIRATQVKFVSEELNDIFIPQAYDNLKHLKLRVAKDVSGYEDLLDGLLWSCHPKIMSVRSEEDLIDSSKFIEVLYEKLRNREENPNCCVNKHIKCWRHFLKGVHQITSMEENIFDNSLCLGFPKVEDISLRLEWF